MPTKVNSLKKDKRRIILDILFENVIPISGDKYWGMDMLLAEIRKHNIDTTLKIGMFDVKNILTSLAKKRKDIDLHMINNTLYFKFT